GKSKRELEELLARRFPQPEVASSIRRLPGPRPEPPAAPAAADATVAGATLAGPPGEPRGASSSVSPVPLPPLLLPAVPAPSSRHRAVVTPVAPDRYRVTFTAGAETREQLQLAQDLLRHAVPNGDTAQIIDRALTALLRDLAREKFAAGAAAFESRLGRSGQGVPSHPG
ncbi:MAG TPA: hypothetical protein VLI67_06730, partial [Vicinamibacteria bacterium]|nr:hypothetical protein [Vicinamibacteria bacterium]